MPRLLIFEPPQSCSSGLCGPDGEDISESFDKVLDDLREKGIEVGRYNLGYHPREFAENELVKQTLAQEGIGVLPLAIVDDVLVTRGDYPTREDLERALGRAVAR